MTTVLFVQLEPKPVTVIATYRRPSASAEWFQHFDMVVLEANKRGSIIIMGDLNADIRKPTKQPGKSLLNSIKLLERGFTALNLLMSLAPLPRLDIIAIDKDILCIQHSVGTLAVSDHLPVIAEPQPQLIIVFSQL